MNPLKVVIVGGGLAAVRTAQELRRRDHDGVIRMISAEPVKPYDRPPLSKQYLSGEPPETPPQLIPSEAFDKLDVALSLDTRAVAIDPVAHTVTLSDGLTENYERLVIATGARPRSLPLLDNQPAVHTLRTFQDARALAAALRNKPHLAVIGGGFIGLEVAATARQAGCEVTVIEAQAAPLVDVIGPKAASWLRDRHLAAGASFRCGTTVVDVSSDRPGSIFLTLGDGSVVTPDLVLVGIGITRDCDWLADGGLAVASGLLCDAAGRTNLPDVFGAGDIVCHRHGDQYRAIAHWTSASDSARQAAQAVLDLDPPGLQDDGYFWSDQYDLRLQFAGQVTADSSLEVLTGSLDDGSFLATCTTGGDVTGLLAVNNPREFALRQRDLASVLTRVPAHQGVLR